MAVLQTPFGLPVKITVGTSKYDGERLARKWKDLPNFELGNSKGSIFKPDRSA